MIRVKKHYRGLTNRIFKETYCRGKKKENEKIAWNRENCSDIKVGNVCLIYLKLCRMKKLLAEHGEDGDDIFVQEELQGWQPEFVHTLKNNQIWG